ncbi:MAG: response regulator [Gemmatimonadales bacterium]|jgi:PAS domain S-box-containing protein
MPAQLPSPPGSAERPPQSSFVFERGGEAEAADESAHVAWVDREVSALLLERLYSAGLTGAVANVAAAALVVALGWRSLPHVPLLVWLGALAILAVVRWLVPRVVGRRGVGTVAVVNSVRVTATLIGLAWGIGAAVALPFLAPASQAVLAGLIVGLLAVASHMLLADRLAARLYAAALLVPPVLQALWRGMDTPHVAILGLLLLFAVLAWRLHAGAHAALIAQLTAVKELEFSERRAVRERRFLSALLGSAPVAIAAVEATGRVTAVNPAFERLFGYTVADCVGRDINDLIVPEWERAAAQALQEDARGGRVVLREMERCRKDGRRVQVRVSAAAVQGDPDGTLFVLYEDVTALKRGEAALREAEAQYRALVESSTDLVFRIDREGRWTFLNQAAREIYETDPEALLGRPFVERVAAEHIEGDRAAFARVLAGERVVDHETVHEGLRGGRRILSFSGLPERDEHGEVAGIIGIARDVGAAVRVRQALEEARDVAERASLAKAAFLANMSHEIRTPLNGILGMVEILLDTELTSDQRRAAELVKTSGEALLDIINNVLDYSKIEAGHVQLEDTAFDLPALVHSVAGLLGARAFEKGIEMVADIAPDLPPLVRGDPGRLRQVLINLVGNAVKFTPRGEVVLRAAPVPADGEGAKVAFEVHDTGIGIPADKLETVFGEFAQADVSTTRSYGGTGLGLAISRRLVRLMGGELSVESTPGSGTVFRFALTLRAERGAPEPARALSSEVLERARVLVVDDNATNRHVIRRFLEDARSVVTDAEDAAAALVALRAAVDGGIPYALAVIDSYMPETDGFQLAEGIRADPRLAGTPLMMLTSAGRRGDAARCQQLGITGYLTKPVSRMELLEAAIAVLVGGAESGRLVTHHTIVESRRRLRILVAEDNAVNQQVARALLVKRGHDVDVVANGREAVAALRKHPYDVVLMDVQMPELDGLQATREARTIPGCEHLPIVAVTAHAFAEDRAKFLAAGMSGVVTKPFKPHQLFAAVEGWSAPPEPDAAVAAGPAGPAAPLDLAALRASLRAGGVEDMLAPLVASFLKDAPSRLAGIEEAVSAGDGERVRLAAHAYRSSAAQLGAVALAAALQALELAGRGGDLAAIPGLAAAVRDAHEAVCAFLAAAVPGGG